MSAAQTTPEMKPSTTRLIPVLKKEALCGTVQDTLKILKSISSIDELSKLKDYFLVNHMHEAHELNKAFDETFRGLAQNIYNELRTNYDYGSDEGSHFSDAVKSLTPEETRRVYEYIDTVKTKDALSIQSEMETILDPGTRIESKINAQFDSEMVRLIIDASQLKTYVGFMLTPSKSFPGAYKLVKKTTPGVPPKDLGIALKVDTDGKLVMTINPKRVGKHKISKFHMATLTMMTADLEREAFIEIGKLIKPVETKIGGGKWVPFNAKALEAIKDGEINSIENTKTYLTTLADSSHESASGGGASGGGASGGGASGGGASGGGAGGGSAATTTPAAKEFSPYADIYDSEFKNNRTPQEFVTEKILNSLNEGTADKYTIEQHKDLLLFKLYVNTPSKQPTGLLFKVVENADTYQLQTSVLENGEESFQIKTSASIKEWLLKQND